jgi:predicted DCC family thiol-disulfide oxidoreductase YuxK
LAVTPRMCTRRVATSITNSTYRRFREIVSTWKNRKERCAEPPRDRSGCPLLSRAGWAGR